VQIASVGTNDAFAMLAGDVVISHSTHPAVLRLHRVSKKESGRELEERNKNKWKKTRKNRKLYAISGRRRRKKMSHVQPGGF